MRRMMRLLCRISVASLLLGTVGCDSIGSLLSPGRPADGAPAKLALHASIPRFQQSTFTRLELGVSSAYQRQDESYQPLTSQIVPLSDDATQQVPVSIELGACLSDPQRRDATADPSACFVRLTLTLLGDGRELDMVQVLGLRLTPGTTTAVPQTVQLFEVATVELRSAATGQPLASGTSILAGSTLSVAARARDATGVELTGRPVTWLSSNTAVATVTAAGVLTGVSAGQTTLSATIGGRTSSASITVTPPLRTLSVVGVASSGNGRIVSTPLGIDCLVTAGVATGSCAFDFISGTSVTLNAQFAPLTARFGGWTGACLANGMATSCALVMDQERATGAAFTALTPVTVQSAGGGVTITSNPVAGIACTLNGATPSGVCAIGFAPGSQIVLTALEFSNARVDSWVGCDASTRTTCTLNLGSVGRLVSVNVVAPRLLLGVPSGNGSGLLTSPPSGTLGDALGLSCGNPPAVGAGRCQASYPINSVVTVTATAQPGSRFVSWQGGGCNAVVAPECVVSLNNPSVQQTQVFARFEPVGLVTLQLSGSGGGTVFADGVPVCQLSAVQTSAQCSVSLGLGSQVEFTAMPLGTGQFLGFGGACAPGPTCTLLIGSSQTISASFTSVAPMVTVLVTSSPGNAGAGFVSTQLEDIACELVFSSASGTCSTMRPLGSTITLVAYDDIREILSGVSVFTRWGPNSPCPNSPQSECTFTLSQTTTVVDATFASGVEIGVEFGGSGPGTITASVPGFRSLPNCEYDSEPDGVLCRVFVPTNSSLTLTIVPAPGFVAFTGGFNACSFSDNTCTFVAEGDASGTITIGVPFDEVFAREYVTMPMHALRSRSVRITSD